MYYTLYLLSSYMYPHTCTPYIYVHMQVYNVRLLCSQAFLASCYWSLVGSTLYSFIHVQCYDTATSQKLEPGRLEKQATVHDSHHGLYGEYHRLSSTAKAGFHSWWRLVLFRVRHHTTGGVQHLWQLPWSPPALQRLLKSIPHPVPQSSTQQVSHGS